jgi:hypothetical protein
LRDNDMARRMPQIFAAVPEVVSGVLMQGARQAWRDWSPLGWEMIKLRGLLTETCAQGDHVHVRPAYRRSLMHCVQILLERSFQPRVQPPAPDTLENNHL